LVLRFLIPWFSGLVVLVVAAAVDVGATRLCPSAPTVTLLQLVVVGGDVSPWEELLKPHANQK